WSDDVHSENLVVLRLADDLNEAFLFAYDARFARCRKGKLADSHVVAHLARLRFGQTNRADFGIAVGAGWNEPQVDRLHILLACDLFDGEYALFRRKMRKQRCGNHIAYCIDVRLAGPQVFVNLNKAALDLDLRS